MRMGGEFRADLEKYYRIDLRSARPGLRRRAKLWLTHFGLHCVAVYRMGRAARALVRRGNPAGLPLYAAYEVLCYLVKMVHHVDIFSADIGPGLYIGHVGTIYVGRTRVGPNLSITHNVTVGVGVSGGPGGLPRIGRDVWIGAGSILYGQIEIGDGVTVNGGTVLSRSVPAHCLVGGNPGRIVLRNYDNSGLFGTPRIVANPAWRAAEGSPGPSVAASDAEAPAPEEAPEERPMDPPADPRGAEPARSAAPVPG
jgi:serine O-acetyltransferase